MTPARFKRARLGLAIEREQARAVMVLGARVAWALEMSNDPAVPLETQLDRLLGEAPIRGWPRPAVQVALDQASSQLKRLSGAPALRDPVVLERAVQASAERFFLRNGSPLLVRVERATDGTLWGAAFHESVVRAVEGSCNRRGIRVRLISAAAAVPRPDVELARHEDAADAGGKNGRGRSAADAPGLALGHADAQRFDLAYRVATTTEPPLCALRPGRHPDVAGASRQRMEVAALLALMLAILAWLAPGLRAARVERQATARLTMLAPARRTVATVERNLDLVTRGLNEVGTFTASRVAITPLLASLARALPPSAALTTVTVDSASGVVVVLAPRAAAVIAALERVSGVTSPALVGPVTEEAVGTAAFERATIRFHLMPRPNETSARGRRE